MVSIPPPPRHTGPAGDGTLACECRTDARVLVVIPPSLEECPELLEFGSSDDWRPLLHLGAVEIHVGMGTRWSGIADLASFLRTILGPGRFGALRAAWVQAAAPIESQLFRLIQAETLAEMITADSSPLAALLNDRRIETWFQPIFQAGTLAVWGFECLMRGRAEDGSVVGALTLLEWARQEHLTFMLDRVSRETHLANAGRVGGGDGLQFLVNFLPTAIYRPEFCLATTVRAAAEAGLEPGRVIFEVVETEQIPDHAHLERILGFYRAKGFRVALDDVGSGYSGLALLGDLKPDLIKIDRDLVSKSVDSPFHRGICEALVKLGQDNGLLVLAEGIETEAQWEVMEQLGANLLQGYLFGRPDPVPVYESRVASRLAPEGTRTG